MKKTCYIRGWIREISKQMWGEYTTQAVSRLYFRVYPDTKVVRI